MKCMVYITNDNNTYDYNNVIVMLVYDNGCDIYIYIDIYK